MPKWTEEQSLAIEDRGKNLLISAAAGSGKTAVLVERIVRLALNGEADIDRMLIVTFTRAAASEMRERIMEAFNREIMSPDGNIELAKRQINLISKSMIMTIHSFCTHILRKYFHRIDLDPNFRVMETVEADILKQESLDEILEEEYKKSEEEGNEEFIKLIEMFTGDRDDRGIEDIVNQVYNFIQSQPYPYEWLDEQIEKFKMDEYELRDSEWYEVITKNLTADIEIARDLLEEALEISEMENGPFIYTENLQKELEAVEDALASSYDISEMVSKANSVSFGRLSSKKCECSKELRDEAKELRNSAKDKLKDLGKNYPDIDFREQAEELNEMYEPMKYLGTLIEKFEDRYREKKTERGSLDFNDLEHRALEVLEDEDIRQDLREYFTHIFVDEYQDSNIVQETIINRIQRKNNLFLVGDVKQSIYRFRLADPTLFIDKYKKFRTDTEYNRRIDLNKNFRSRREVLEWVNFIFGNIMSEEVGEVEYDDDSKLYTGASYEESEDDRKTEINIIDTAETEEKSEIDDYLNELKKEEIEARFIARRIKELRTEKTYDPKTGEFRQIQNRDIVILLRTMKNKADIYEQVLLESEIPVYTDADKGYFSAVEIKVFLNLLRVIDNRRQDIPLISTMKSFIGGFSLEELTEIRLRKKDSSFYESLLEYAEENDDELSGKVREFLKRIDRWREMSRVYKLDEFIWRVMIESDYYYYIGTLVNGKQRQANLEMLVDKANEIEKTSISGLFNFIRFSDRLRDIDSDFGTAKILGENEDVVRIMSIHKSKGLEFPVVICADLSKMFNRMDLRNPLLFHKDLGIGIDYIDIERRVKINTISKKAIKEQINIELLSEEMRVLYVAMTRAKDKLILFGTADLKDEKNLSLDSTEGNISFHNIIKRNSYMDWIRLAVENDRSYDGNYNIIIKSREDLRDIEIKRDERKSELKEKLKTLEDGEYEDSLCIRRLEWEYPYQEETEAKSRFGATAYLRMINEEEHDIHKDLRELNETPNFMKASEEKVTGAEIGTAVHSIIDSMDFTKKHDAESIRAKAEELREREIITESEIELIDFGSIEKFFESELYDRILNASKIRKEQTFVYKMEDIGSDIYIQGIIDCAFEEDGEIVLLDYKTDRNRNADYFIENYRDQLGLYEEAISNILKKPVKEKIIYSLYNGEAYTVN